MIWDLVGKVCESPNDKLWNCSSISETNGKLWNQKEPSILPTKLADVGAITISKQLIWHVQQLHKRSSTAIKKVAKLLNTERCESKNLGKHHSISVDWAFTITLSFFFQTTPRWNYQYLPWGWGWWCPTSHPGTRFPVLEPPPRYLATKKSWRKQSFSWVSGNLWKVSSWKSWKMSNSFNLKCEERKEILPKSGPPYPMV